MRDIKKIDLGDGSSLHVEGINPTDENFDAAALFHEIWDHIADSEDYLAYISITTCINYQNTFFDYFGSLKVFKKLSKEHQYSAMQATDNMIETYVEREEFGRCNGCSLFQLWLASVINDDEAGEAQITATIASIKNKIQ